MRPCEQLLHPEYLCPLLAAQPLRARLDLATRRPPELLLHLCHSSSLIGRHGTYSVVRRLSRYFRPNPAENGANSGRFGQNAAIWGSKMYYGATTAAWVQAPAAVSAQARVPGRARAALRARAPALGAARARAPWRDRAAAPRALPGSAPSCAG